MKDLAVIIGKISQEELKIVYTIDDQILKLKRYCQENKLEIIKEFIINQWLNFIFTKSWNPQGVIKSYILLKNLTNDILEHFTKHFNRYVVRRDYFIRKIQDLADAKTNFRNILVHNLVYKNLKSCFTFAEMDEFFKIIQTFPQR